MNSYIITGKDPDSDSGTWTVIVEGKTRQEADKNARRHLRRLGREDLVKTIRAADFTRITPSDYQVIYSTVDRDPHGQDSF